MLLDTQACYQEVKEVANFDDLEKIQSKVANDPKTWLSCLKQMEKHPGIVSTAITQFWHNINGEQVFGTRCKYLDQDAKEKKIFTLLSEKGFRTLEYPVYHQRVSSKLGGGETSSHPRGIIRFTEGGKTYYISEINKVGDDFDLVQGATYASKNHVKTYDALLKKNGKKTNFSPTSHEENSERDLGAKSCIKYQIDRYIGFYIQANKLEGIPSDKEIYNDYYRINNQETKAKYKRSITQIKSEMYERAMKGLEDCKGIFTASKEFDKSFNEYHDKKLQAYKKIRKEIYP